MKANTIVKIALVLVGITVLFYWQEVWAWVSAKSVSELTGDILGFCLKWFFLAIFGFLAVQIPHYISPWLKLARVNSRRKLKEARRGRGAITAAPRAPRMNKDQALAWMASQMAKRDEPSHRPPQLKSRVGEDANKDVRLRL